MGAPIGEEPTESDVEFPSARPERDDHTGVKTKLIQSAGFRKDPAIVCRNAKTDCRRSSDIQADTWLDGEVVECR
jgi:hypothetical protein